jgi:hypothetical protein
VRSGVISYDRRIREPDVLIDMFNKKTCDRRDSTSPGPNPCHSRTTSPVVPADHTKAPDHLSRRETSCERRLLWVPGVHVTVGCRHLLRPPAGRSRDDRPPRWSRSSMIRIARPRTLLGLRAHDPTRACASRDSATPCRPRSVPRPPTISTRRSGSAMPSAAARRPQADGDDADNAGRPFCAIS